MEKQRWEESEKRRKNIREEKELEAEGAGAWKGSEVAIYCSFPKSRFTLSWGKAYFQVKMYKIDQMGKIEYPRITFGNWHVRNIF